MLLGSNLTATFIVKIWIEVDEKENRKVWRGYIQHIPSENKVYLKSLEEINVYMGQYLKAIGEGRGV
jgi:hypothetical protein